MVCAQPEPRGAVENLDIPPRLTVSSYYPRTLFDDRVTAYDGDLTKPGEIKLETSAVLPKWRVKDVRGAFDVFVNAFSFQEMEPNVVEHYIDAICRGREQARRVAQLPQGQAEGRAARRSPPGWVLEPVTSQLIVDLFSARGHQLQGRYNAPLIYSAGELVVLSRSDLTGASPG